MKNFKKLIISLLFSICFIGYNSKAESQGFTHLLEAESQDSQPPASQAQVNTVEVLLNSGIEKARSGDFDKAFADLNKVIEMDPRNADAYMARADLKMRLNRNEGAIADLDIAIEIDSQRANAHAETFADVDKDIEEIDTRLSQAYNNRGVAKLGLGRYYEALMDLNTSIEINPRNAEAYYNRGLVKKDLQRYEDSLTDLNTSIEINPRNAEAYYNRGLVKKDLQRYEDSLTDLNTSIEINPESIDTYFERADVKILLERPEEALTDLSTIIEIDPRNGKAYHNRGLVNNMLNRHEQAIADYDKVIEINPRSAEAYFNRGLIKIISLGRNEEGQTDMKKVLELELDNQDALLFAPREYVIEKYNQDAPKPDKPCPSSLTKSKSS